MYILCISLWASFYIYTHNTVQRKGIKPCYKPRCQLCPRMYSGNTITGPNNITHNIRDMFTCSSANVMSANLCRQCPSVLYTEQTRQSLHKRMTGHKSDIRNDITQKPVSENFSLPRCCSEDLKVAILEQKQYRTSIQRERERYCS